MGKRKRAFQAKDELREHCKDKTLAVRDGQECLLPFLLLTRELFVCGEGSPICHHDC